MSARPPGGIPGLPSKPVGANMPGPAPPLPTGPPPAQPSYPQQDAQAAHAAAWAAYYQASLTSSHNLPADIQAQGQAGYAAAPGATPGAAPTANNPYANYGYSAAASAQHSAHISTPYAGQAPAASTFRPPSQPYQAAPYSGPQQPQANYAQGYQYPQQYGQAGQAGYQWPAQPAQPQPQAGPNQPYRPPQQGYQTPNQPFYPQQQAFSPVRPSPSPGPTAGPNRPYQPQPLPGNRAPSGPAHPHVRPMGGPGASPTAFPPAKRPRFDGPGGMSGPGTPAGPAGNMQPRPHGNIRPPPSAMNNHAQQGFNARPPSHPSLPSAPTAPSAPGIPAKPVGPVGAPSGPSGARNNPPPITRPPIHLGFNTPTPTPVPIATPFGVPMRGSFAGRGMRGGARGGAVLNAPRGPAGMRRQDQVAGRKEVDRKRREKEKDRYKEREERITMTDFRIVGIEVKGLDWTWGLIGGEQPEDKNKEEEKAKVDKVEEELKTEAAETEANGHVAEPTAEADVKRKAEQDQVAEEAKLEESTEAAGEEKDSVPSEQAVKSEALETVEEKRGEKRKAKSPDLSEGSSPKKRSGEYLLTHGKPNEPSALPASSSAVSDSSQNRFRIYFESPAELDRVPKALRRNPNKRWRRASSSVAPSVAGARAGREDTVATVEEGVEVPAEAPVEASAEIAEKEQSVPAAPAQEVVGEQPAEHAVAESSTETLQESAEDAVEAITEISAAAPADHDDITTEGVADTVNGEPSSAINGDSTALAEAPVQDTPVDPTPGQSESQDASAVTGSTETDEHEVGDVSMRTDGGDLAEIVSGEAQAAADTEVTEAAAEVIAEPTSNGRADTADIAGTDSSAVAPTTAAIDTPLAQSADNAASAYKSRTRRRSSVSSAGSADDNTIDPSIPTPSTNRVSILYEGSSRRICVDADLVSKVKIHRAEGRIEVVLNAFAREGENKDLPRGVLIETYDPVDQRFVSASSERLEELWADQSDVTVPPFQREPTQEQMVITVWLNLVRPLSEPKWCRSNSADEWLIEQFGARKASTDGGWKGKLEVIDPDPAPTLPEILRSWVTSSSVGSESDRESFTKTLSADPNDLLEILLRLTRGDRVPAASSGGSLGPLATAIRADSPFASHQTHVSLAILAMYRLTTDYAKKAGESTEVVNEKISDIIKSLPVGMISRSLDGLFREWAAQ